MGKDPSFKTLRSANLSPQEKLLIQKLKSFEAPYLEEKILEKRIFQNSNEYHNAFTEFKKFMALTQLTRASLAVLNDQVDEVWHQFILFTEEYHDFCQNIAGKYIHHSPSTSSRPLPQGAKEETVYHYKRIFGKLDEQVLSEDYRRDSRCCT